MKSNQQKTLKKNKSNTNIKDATGMAADATIKATQTYTRNPESLPLVRMFMTAEQKAAETLPIPNSNLNMPTSLSASPNFTVDNSLIQHNLTKASESANNSNNSSNSSGSSTLIKPAVSTPNATTLNNIHGQLGDLPSRPNTVRDLTPPDHLSGSHEFLVNHNGGRLVPGASPPRNLMNSPVSKLVPLSRSGSAEGGGGGSGGIGVGGKPMIRARSHSEQRPIHEQQGGGGGGSGSGGGNRLSPFDIDQHPQAASSLKNAMSNVSSPLARRVRSATTLRPPSDEDSVNLKSLVNNKQQHYQVQQAQIASSTPATRGKEPNSANQPSDSHRRSISADNASSNKKVCQNLCAALFFSTKLILF